MNFLPLITKKEIFMKKKVEKWNKVEYENK